MKDLLSLYLLKNSFGLKMKKGFRNLCTGESSTSILDPQKADSAYMVEQPRRSSVERERERERQPTLEEMIMRLEMEEKMARKSKMDGHGHRMSCVSSCDILRSARKALNQYPRFSLDGKDAMYRSSFTGEMETERKRRVALPGVVGGESVIWCKPGVVGKLMGLDAMPVPLNTNYRRERLNAIIKRQNQQKQQTGVERRRVAADGRRRGVVGSCSRAGYCVVKPVELEIPNGDGGWHVRRRFV